MKSRRDIPTICDTYSNIFQNHFPYYCQTNVDIEAESTSPRSILPYNTDQIMKPRTKQKQQQSIAWP